MDSQTTRGSGLCGEVVVQLERLCRTVLDRGPWECCDAESLEPELRGRGGRWQPQPRRGPVERSRGGNWVTGLQRALLKIKAGEQCTLRAVGSGECVCVWRTCLEIG